MVGPFFFESFTHDDVIPNAAHLYERLGAGRTLVRYSPRGTGHSQRDVPQFTIDGWVRDIEAIASAASLSRFAFLGWGLSGMPALEFSARHPGSVTKLILYAAWARITELMPREQILAFANMARADWKMTSQMLADVGLRTQEPEFTVRLAEHYRWTMSGEWFADMCEEVVDQEVDLGSIGVPTIVLHRRDDATQPFASAQRLAAGIPDARLLPLEGDITYPSVGNYIELADAINTAIDGDKPVETDSVPRTRVEPSQVQAIIFTDLVGHTEMMSRLGDEKGREVLRQHERITRELLAAHSGTEVKTMGDGFMASFASIVKAMDCAVALQRAFAEHNASQAERLDVRIGLNAGEPIEEEGDLFGATVIMASRVAAKANAGEILIPEPLRHLLIGKGYVYADRGETLLTGFEDAVRLFEVRWQE